MKAKIWMLRISPFVPGGSSSTIVYRIDGGNETEKKGNWLFWNFFHECSFAIRGNEFGNTFVGFLSTTQMKKRCRSLRKK